MADIDQSKLQGVLNARKKKKSIEDRIAQQKQKRIKLKEASKKFTKEIKEDKEKLKQLEDEKVLIIELAGYGDEPVGKRNTYAGNCLFDLLAKFDVRKQKADATFSQKINSLQKTELIAKAVLESAIYYDDSDSVRIDGKTLRPKIEQLLSDKKSAIAKANETLDAEWKKLFTENQISL